MVCRRYGFAFLSLFLLVNFASSQQSGRVVPKMANTKDGLTISQIHANKARTSRAVPVLTSANDIVRMRKNLGNPSMISGLPSKSFRKETAFALTASVLNVPATYPTIQAAINAAANGDTINVYPGTYSSDVANGFDPTTGGSGSNDFNIFVNKSVTIRGVDGSGNPITNVNSLSAFVVAQRDLPTFGADAFFVQADNVTISGLDITGYNDLSLYNNKTVEVAGDNFTLKNCNVHGLDQAAAVYMSDWHFNSGTNTSYIQSYHLSGNIIDAGGPDANGLRIASGAGWSGSVLNRVISGNTFTDAIDNIAFVGPGAEAWDLYPVGAATITGNAFNTAARRHVIAWGVYQSNLGYANLDWQGILTNNTFDAGVVPWTPTNDVRTWDNPTYGFYNVRGIYSHIQAYAVAFAQSGDHVQILAGTYVDTLNIGVPLTLYGAGQGLTIIYPLTSNPNPCPGSSLCGGSATNIILVGADNVTIHDLTLDGDNPNLTSGIVAGGADLDARNGIIENFPLGVFNNLTVYNVTVKNIYLRGMYASSGGTFNFHDDTVRNVQADPSSIAMFNFGGSGVFANNTVSDAGDAISSNWSRGTSYLNNTISNSGSGIHTDNAGGSGYLHADTIAGNSVLNSPDGGYGIWDFVPYVSPVIRDNNVTNVYVGLGSFGGVLSSGNPGTSFIRNTVDGQNKSNSTGFYLSNTEFGFGVSNVAANLLNNIVKNNVYGFWIESTGGDTVRLSANANSIISNTTQITTDSVTAYNGGNGTVGTLLGDLRGNWWGSTSAPAVGGPSAGSVTFSPWLGIGTDAQPATNGFQPVNPMNWFMNSNSTVQSAVDFVAANDTLNILAGTYEEQVELAKTLIVKGVGTGVTDIKSPVHLVKSFTTSSPNFPIVFVHDADGVVIQNLTVDGAGRGVGNYRFEGIGIHNAGGLISGCEIKDVRENPLNGDQHGNAIYAYVDNGVPRVLQVLNNTVYGFQKNGITLNGTNLGGTVSGNTVNGAGATNLIAQNGVQIGFGGSATVSGNTISGFSYTPATDAACGVLMYEPTGPITTSNNAITEAQIGVSYVNVGGMVSNNTIHATLAGVGTPSLWGIDVDPGSVIHVRVQPVDADNASLAAKFRRTISTTITTTVQQNVLTGDGSTGTGIEMDASSGQTVNVTTTQNLVNGWATGVVYWTDSPSSTLNASVNDNNLAGNIYGAVNSTSATQDASANWWGSGTGPKIVVNPGGAGDSVSGGVDFTPWLNSGTDMNPGTFGFQGDYSVLDVLAASPQTGPLGRIQEGVNLVTGTLVNVLSGTYEEQVELQKPVTLLGSGSASTTIKSPVTLTKFFTTSAANYPIVYAHDADSINVENLTVDGAGRGNSNYRFIGVGYHDAGGTLSGCTLEDIRETPINGNQHGVAIYAYVDNSTPRVVQVTNNALSGFQKNGMALNGNNLTANVTGNTVTGAGAVNFIAQNGIQIGFGGTGSVIGNTISGFSYTPATDASCGALLTDPTGPIVTSNNLISESQIGIYYNNVGGTISGNTIHATAAGVGVPNFWGIEVDPGAAPKIRFQPFDQPSQSKKSSLKLQGLTATINTTVRSNSLTGDGTNGTGLEMDALGTDLLNVNASRNTIGQWGTGVYMYSDPTATLSAIVDSNTIAGNVYGVFNQTGILQNALYNWWGNSTGPRDIKTLPNVPNYNNVSGLGDSVSSHVDYNPWFLDAGMTTPSVFTLNATSTGNGSVSVNPNQASYTSGTVVQLSASPSLGYHFASWSGDTVSATNPIFVTMNSNKNIVANFAINQYTINASSGANGSISPSGTVTENYGSSQTFTFTPTSGYRVDSVIVDGVNQASAPSYTFSGIVANHTIRVTFTIIQYSVSASSGPNGSITPSGTLTVNSGDSLAFTITPSVNYHISDVVVDGSSVGAVSTYKFTNITANHTIVASFSITGYTITATAGANGTIAPSGPVGVNSGTDTSFTITPNTGYHLDSIFVDGVYAGHTSPYLFTNIMANHTITAKFAIDQFTMTSSVNGGNGTINPSGSTLVNYGQNQSFTFTPATGYHIDTVLVDGGYAGNTSPYVFVNVTAGHTISVKFAINTYTIVSSVIGANGTIAPSGTTVLNSGGGQSYTMTPATGYHIDSVYVDGVFWGRTSPYNFSGVTSNHTIAVKFAINTYTIVATVIGANGTIVPPGTTVVDYGTNQQYTMTPAAGYHIDTLFVDGSASGNTSPYTFSGVTANHTIAVKFAINNYLLTVNVVGSGSVTKLPNQPSYNYGTSVQLTAIPLDYTWIFTGWTGSVTTTANPILLLTDSAMTLTANFVRDSSYLNSYRSFTMDSIAYDRDNHGKLGKYVLLKPIYGEFTVPLQNLVDNVTGLHIEFASSADTIHFPFEVVPSATHASTDGRYKRWDIIFDSPLHAGDSVFIHGFAQTTKGQKVTLLYWTHFNTKAGPISLRGPIINVMHMPMPNRINALVQSFLEGGYWKTKGLLVGYPCYDSSKVYGWYLAPNYREVLETLRDRTGIQSGTPRNFDYYANGRPLIKQQAHLEPSRFNDKLFGDIVTLQFNIAASALGITPHGFGELVYDDGTSNPLNGFMVRQIDSVADSMMVARTYSARFASKSTFESKYGYVNMDSTIARINRAFEGTLDTISFISSLQFKGTRQLSSVSYLKKMPSGINVAIIERGPNILGTLPQQYALYQNYPNPFNPTTTLRFDLPENSIVTLKVYNLLGQEVSTLLNAEQMEQGTQAVQFNAGNLASGVYFYRIVAQRVDEDGIGSVAFQTVKKMLLLK